MQILVLSDIHANLTALDAVLEDAGTVDEVWCLGDIVGYGPDPNECVQRIRSLAHLTCVLGNHDAAVLGRIPLDAFHQDARHAIYWTRAILTRENLEWLAEIPEKQTVENFTLVHGSPRNPIWEYLLDPVSAAQNFAYFETDFCLIGHTHIPLQFALISPEYPARWTQPMVRRQVHLRPRTIINPGSVGQPRDHDPRAAYAILDTEENIWLARRVLYDIESVQERILNAELPRRHAARLSDGW